jgi:4'-phosphopantetheinyl transferase
VALWVFDFSSASDAETARFEAQLHPQERERNRRYRQPDHRRRDIICRGALRELLCHYLNIPNEQLLLSRGENGKPYINSPDTEIQFNCSHSRDCAAITLCRGPNIGVDIEFCQRNNDLAAISHRYFSSDEVAALHALPLAAQRYRFFQYWTLKEAYIKARGEGIYLGLDKFSFELNDEKPDEIRVGFISDEFDRADRWQFLQIAPVDNYLVSVAVEASSRTYSLATATMR